MLRNNDLDFLWNRLKQYIPNLTEELGEVDKEKFAHHLRLTLLNCTEAIVRPHFQKANLGEQHVLIIREESAKTTSIKPNNYSFNIFDWIDVAWKTGGLIVAASVFGPWITVGLLLVLRDITKMFAIEPSKEHGEVLLILRKLMKEKDSVSINELMATLQEKFGRDYKKAQVIRIVKDLTHLKCVDFKEAQNQIILKETVFVIS